MFTDFEISAACPGERQYAGLRNRISAVLLKDFYENLDDFIGEGVMKMINDIKDICRAVTPKMTRNAHELIEDTILIARLDIINLLLETEDMDEDDIKVVNAIDYYLEKIPADLAAAFSEPLPPNISRDDLNPQWVV